MRLQMSHVQPSFSGRLYFILGPGMGDTLNDLRILHKVLAHYPDATPVVYADPRWKEVYACIPELHRCQLQYHMAAPSSITQQHETITPYHRTFKGLVREILVECRQGAGLVALGGFKLPDQLARKESTLMMKARAIGLGLKESECRPYFPLPENALSSAQQFLKAQGLTPGHYFVVAPYTWPDKMWEQRSWEILIDSLYKATGIPTLVIGVNGYPKINGTVVREALELPLSQAAALIAQARCYIGLDTGPTHLAACFDVPVVALNPQGKFPPFLVEPHTPFKWIHLTPGIYGSKSIPVTSVFEIVCKALEYPMPLRCPVCAAQPYVLGAQNGILLYLCRCGLVFRTRGEKAEKEREEVQIPFNQHSGTSIALPTTLDELANFSFRLNQMKERLETVTFLLEHWDRLEMDPLTLLNNSTSREVWWNWDSAYLFLSKLGLRILENQLRPIKAMSDAAFSVEIRAVPSESREIAGKLQIPWGRKTVVVNRSTYERWLTWGAFRNQGELEGLGWHLVNEGEREQGRFILKMVFRIRPRWRALRRLMLATCWVTQNDILRIGY